MGTLDQPQAPQVPTSATRLRWRSRRRVVWTLSLVFVLVLIPTADVVARHLAERAAESALEEQLSSAERPEVELGGTPFIPQLVAGKLSSITLDVRGATNCGVRIDRLHAELRGVRGSGGTTQAKSIEGEVLLRYSDLNKTIAPLELSDGADGRIAIGAGGPLLGARATGLPRIENGELVIEPEGLTATLGGHTVLDGNLGPLPAVRIPLRELPSNLNLRLVSNAEGVVLAFAGTDVRVDPEDSCPNA